MDRNDFDWLLPLKLVAEKKNFASAARELRITPSALSQGIKQLERRLGAALLLRTTRTTQLTEAGAKFLEQAGPAMEQILLALQDVGANAKKPSGLLRINTLTYAYASFLEPRVAIFLRDYPDISVEMVLDDTPSDIFSKGFDAGIRLSDILAQDLVAVKLFGPIRWVVAGSPKYFKKNASPAHPKDLLSHNCIRVRSGQSIYDKWEFERAGKTFDVQVEGSFILNSPVLAADAAAAGMGLVYIAEDVIRESLDAGKLKVILSEFSPESSGYYLYFPRHAQMQSKLRVFIDHLKSAK